MKRTFIILLTLMTALITQPAFAANRVLSLDGDGDYMLVPDSPSLDISHMTLELWVLPNALNQQTGAGLLTKGTGRGGEVYSIDISGNAYRGFFWKQGQSYNVRSPYPITTFWTHVACTYNGDRLALYINGQQVAVESPAVGDLESNNHEVSIGGRQSGSKIYDLLFNGLIDEVRIWNIARTQEEIQMTMHTTLSGKEMGLVGYWRFDEEGGRIAANLSAYGNDGQLFGNAKFVDPDLQLELVPTTANFISVPKNYPTIQAAIDAAGKGDVVVVSPGTYRETIRLKSGVMVRGMDAVIRGDGNAIVEADNVTNASLIGFTIDGMDVAKNGILCKDAKTEFSLQSAGAIRVGVVFRAA